MAWCFHTLLPQMWGIQTCRKFSCPVCHRTLHWWDPSVKQLASVWSCVLLVKCQRSAYLFLHQVLLTVIFILEDYTRKRHATFFFYFFFEFHAKCNHQTNKLCCWSLFVWRLYFSSEQPSSVSFLLIWQAPALPCCWALLVERMPWFSYFRIMHLRIISLGRCRVVWATNI